MVIGRSPLDPRSVHVQPRFVHARGVGRPPPPGTFPRPPPGLSTERMFYCAPPMSCAGKWRRRSSSLRMDDVTLGRSIRVVRIKRRIRQADLAEAAGVAQPTISRIEAGRLDRVTLGTIERVFDESRDPAHDRGMVGGRGARSAARRPPLGDARCARAAVRVAARTGSTAPEVTFAIYGERGVDRHPRVARADPQPARDRAQDGDRRRPGDGRDARSEASACREGRRRAWLGARVRLGLAADRRQPDQPAPGPRASVDAALGLPGRRPHGSLGWLRAPHGAIAAISFLSSTPGASASRELAPVRRVSAPAPERGRRAIVDLALLAGYLGHVLGAPVAPSTRSASAWVTSEAGLRGFARARVNRSVAPAERRWHPPWRLQGRARSQARAGRRAGAASRRARRGSPRTQRGGGRRPLVCRR